ncbi:MAG: hypothetical protein F4Z40_03695 [Chloroflexi bacterium]|nr:hypothetical protein [Chloroflexota bacterium]
MTPALTHCFDVLIGGLETGLPATNAICGVNEPAHAVSIQHAIVTRGAVTCPACRQNGLYRYLRRHKEQLPWGFKGLPRSPND